MSETTLTVSGNLTANPVLRNTSTGHSVASFTVASTQRVSGSDWQATEPVFIDVVAWRHLAEHAAESFSRGDRIIATGYLRRRSWETENGQSRHTMELHAHDLGASIRFANVSIRKPHRNPAADAILTTSDHGDQS